jgi:hypothetical protein
MRYVWVAGGVARMLLLLISSPLNARVSEDPVARPVCKAALSGLSF